MELGTLSEIRTTSKQRAYSIQTSNYFQPSHSGSRSETSSPCTSKPSPLTARAREWSMTSRAFHQKGSKITRNSAILIRMTPRTTQCTSENIRTNLTAKFRWPTIKIRCTKTKETATYLVGIAIVMTNNIQKRRALRKIGN
jgi:hypothetical protein